MKYGTINCTCGQSFYFEKSENIIGYEEEHTPIYDDLGPLIVNCIKCKKSYDVITYPEKLETLEDPAIEVGEEDGTDI